VADRVIAGRYRLERRIGAGAMSEVWAAEDLELERTVAVKLRAADAAAERFDREARAAASLSHTNICALYDYGEDDGRRFMVLEYLPGGSLDERLEHGKPLPDDDVHRISAEIAAGLAHAHLRGVVHRDLKPANILFDPQGRAKIADFGIARVAGAAGLTEVGTVLGTAAYISPEQAAGEEATPASDVYAFGVILFRMLTGRLPFESPDAMAMTVMHRDLPSPSVSEFRADAPPRLESVATAALAKSPSDRPRDGTALAAELGPPTAMTEVAVPPPPPSRRRRWLIGLAVAAIAAGGIALATAITLGNGSPASPSSTSIGSTTRPTRPATTEPATTEAAPAATEPATTATSTAATTTPETTTAATTTTAPPTLLTTTIPITTASPPPTAATTTGTIPPPTTAPTDATATTTAQDTTTIAVPG
jgi:serine/threonine-protein kinase